MNRVLPFLAALGVALAAPASAMCPVLPGPFTQGNVCPYADPSKCFTAEDANAIVQDLLDVCLWVDTNAPTLASLQATAARVAGDLGGAAASPQVTSTHLAAPLPGAQGGLGAAQPACGAGQYLSCNGSACGCAAISMQPYDIGFYFPGKPTNGQVLAQVVVPRAVSITEAYGESSSRCLSRTPATGSTSVIVKKRAALGTETQIGTLTFAAGGTTCVADFTADTALTAGDSLVFVAPATVDVTLAAFSVTIGGVR